jgi:hypothetical protein
LIFFIFPERRKKIKRNLITEKSRNLRPNRKEIRRKKYGSNSYEKSDYEVWRREEGD